MKYMFSIVLNIDLLFGYFPRGGAVEWEHMRTTVFVLVHLNTDQVVKLQHLVSYLNFKITVDVSVEMKVIAGFYHRHKSR